MTALTDSYVREVVERLSGRLRDGFASGALDVAHLEDAEVASNRMYSVVSHLHEFDQVAGPFYDTQGLEDVLGISRQAIHKRVKARTLLGCRTSDGVIVYPAWQFKTDWATIGHLQSVLDILATGVNDPWTWALWLSGPVDTDVDHQVSVAQWLAEGRDPAPVLADARADADRWRQ